MSRNDDDKHTDVPCSPLEDVKSSDSQIETNICSHSESPISTTDENSKISSLICDDNNLPPLSPVCETVVVTSDERNELVASPREIRKNVSKKKKKEELNIKALLPSTLELKNSVPEIALSEEDIVPYGQAVPCDVEYLLSGRRLGTGASGEVFECIDESTNLHMAYKRMEMTKYEEGQIAKHELETIKKTGNKEINQYIVKYYYAVMTPQGDRVVFHIFMEYMDTTVTAFYKELHKEARFNSDERNAMIYRLIQNLASALAFLEENDIVHRDIKPDNMLVNKKGQFKLCDLGLCTSRTKLKKEGKCVVGTVCYKPPRPAEDPIHDDMWRFGVSLLEICNGKHPYADRYGDSVNGIFALENEWKPIFETEISITIMEIILKLLAKEPAHRFNSFRDILEMEDIHKFDRSPSESELKIIHSIINS